MKTAIFSIGVFLISLFLGSCQPSETSCSVVDTGKTLDYKIGDKLLFSYNYTTVYPAPGVDSVYKRSGFIHPLKTLGGEVMTNCSPADHYHHFGLWYAWTKTTFEGNEIDFWNLHKKQGTVRFRNFEHVSDNGFVATLDHVVYPDSPAEKVAMNERLEINIGTTSLPGYYIDYHTTIRLASPSPITMEAYRYGGICIRTREDWNDQTAEMLTSEGLSRDEADGSRARISAINAENQQIIKQTPNFTPKNVKLGVFILFKTNHIRSENNLIKNRTNEKNNQFIFRKISYLCSK